MTALGRPRMAIKIYKPDRCDAANGSSEPILWKNSNNWILKIFKKARPCEYSVKIAANDSKEKQQGLEPSFCHPSPKYYGCAVR